MSDVKHTPGPWEYDKRLNSVYGADGTPVCYSVEPQRTGAHTNENDDERRRANGELIAAAPEMWALLEESVWPLRDDDEVQRKIQTLLARIEGA